MLTFSPDGRWVAFTRSANQPGGNVYAMSLRHPSTVKKLGLSWGYRSPAWAPRQLTSPETFRTP